MDITSDAVVDLWDAINGDAANLLENVGVDAGVFVPIVVTVLISMAIWRLVGNLFG